LWVFNVNEDFVQIVLLFAPGAVTDSLLETLVLTSYFVLHAGNIISHSLVAWKLAMHELMEERHGWIYGLLITASLMMLAAILKAAIPEMSTSLLSLMWVIYFLTIVFGSSLRRKDLGALQRTLSKRQRAITKQIQSVAKQITSRKGLNLLNILLEDFIQL
jgi:hypothetical protein